MDWDDMLSLMTLGAVLPYLVEAGTHWFRIQRRRMHPAGAPMHRPGP